MSRASIFDRLHRLQPAPEPDAALALARDDYDPERLRLIDGVALTSAGFIGADVVPEPRPAALSSSLYSDSGYRLLVHEVADLPSLTEPRLARLDAKAGRLYQLIQATIIDVVMMLEAIPDNGCFDVVISAPVRSSQAAEFISQSVLDVLNETQFGERLGDINLVRQSGDPHSLLQVKEKGGMPYVLWIAIDSLLNNEDIVEHQRVLGQSSAGASFYPGEAVAAVLVQRLLPVDGAFSTGWELKKGSVHEHPPRAECRTNQKRQALIGLLESIWVPGQEGEEPARLVIDCLGLPGRAVELGGSLIECWPGIDLIDDGLAVDAYCGWVGVVVPTLMLVMAMAELEVEQQAVIVAVNAETTSKAWLLRSYANETAQLEEAHS